MKRQKGDNKKVTDTLYSVFNLTRSSLSPRSFAFGVNEIMWRKVLFLGDNV